MLALSLFAWWYGRGWVNVLHNVPRMMLSISRLFSVPILLRTLFAPWKRIITYPGASLDAKLRALGDNIVSRAVGFVVRLCVLLAALILEVFALIAGIAGVILWPLVPLISVGLILKGAL